jgi:hypothetical protein
MANNEFTTTLSRRAHARRMLRTTVFVAALGAAVGPPSRAPRATQIGTSGA